MRVVRREEQAAARKSTDLHEINHEQQILETFVRYQGRLYGEDQVTDLMAALGAAEDLLRERVELLNNVAKPGEDPKFLSIERLSAKNYQTRLLLEFAESDEQQQLVQRLLCSRARVDLQKLRNGFLSNRDFPNLTAAAEQLRDAQLFIDDTAGISIGEMRAKARRLKSQHGIQLIVIDYLQLLRSTSRRARARDLGNIRRN